MNKKPNCFRISFFIFLAYRLKKCPPPPMVEQAEILLEDQDYEIGMNSWTIVKEYQRHDEKKKY